MLKRFKNMIINTDNICHISEYQNNRFLISFNNGDEFVFFRTVRLIHLSDVLIEMTNKQEKIFEDVFLFTAVK